MKIIAITLALAGGWDMLGPPAAVADGFMMLGERPRPDALGAAGRAAEADATGGPARAGRPLPRRLVVYTADWCGPCRAFRADAVPKLKARGWRFGDGPRDHVTLVDCTACLPEGVTALPTFVLLEGGAEVGRHVGPLDAWGVGELVKGYSERPARAAKRPPARWTRPR